MRAEAKVKHSDTTAPSELHEGRSGNEVHRNAEKHGGHRLENRGVTKVMETGGSVTRLMAKLGWEVVETAEKRWIGEHQGKSVGVTEAAAPERAFARAWMIQWLKAPEDRHRIYAGWSRARREGEGTDTRIGLRFGNTDSDLIMVGRKRTEPERGREWVANPGLKRFCAMGEQDPTWESMAEAKEAIDVAIEALQKEMEGMQAHEERRETTTA